MRSHKSKSIIRRILIATVGFSVLFSYGFIRTVSAQSGTIRFENISTEQGLSQSTVNAILQDRQGFLWFATEGGLNQYDGYQFTVYQHDSDDPRSLSANLVFTFFEDRDGILWVGTGAGLDRFDRSSGTFIHYPQDQTGSDKLNGMPVFAINQDQSGTLWVGTNGGGLDALDLSTNQITDYRHDVKDPKSLSNDIVNSIYVSREGEVWIGTDGGLDRFDSKSGSFVHDLQGLPGSLSMENAPVRTTYEDDQGRMWIGTMQGLIRWDRATNRFDLYQHDPNNPQSLSDNSIKQVLEDSQGNLWVGTLRGLNQYDKTQNNFIRYVHDPNNPDSLSSDYIRSIFEDRSGVLWIGTSFGGLNKYARSTQKFTLFKNHPGLSDNLSDNNTWSIYKDRSGNLWIGTFFSGLNKLEPDSGKVTIYQNDPSNPISLSDNEIRAILQDRNGFLWIGTENGGLNRLDPTTGIFLHYQHNPDDPTSLSSNHVFYLYEDHLGGLWIGSEQGTLDRFDRVSGTFTHYQHDANDPMSLSDNNVRAIYEDHDGALWIGTEQGGLNLWDNQDNHFKIYKHDPKDPSSLCDDWVGSIFEDKNGALWIGTRSGLDSFNRNTQTFTHYTLKNGLPDDTIYGILADAQGNLWLSTNKGLSKFNPAAGTFRNYDFSDGLQGNQFNPGAYFQAQNGEMFFGGTKGFNEFNPDLVNDNPIPPPVVITDIKKYNQTIQTNLGANQSIQLSYRDNFISFDFSALDYNAPEKNQYAYKLDGVDQDWVYAGTRRYASYTNLRGGDYTFRVKAANNDGVWTEQATTLQIHITPPFWQTWWFIGMICLVAGAGAFGGYRLRVRDIEARNRDLAQRVEQRTHQLAALNMIAAVVSQSLDLKEIMSAALDKTIEVMGMEMGVAYRLEFGENETEPHDCCIDSIASRNVSDNLLQHLGNLPLHMATTEHLAEIGDVLVWRTAEYPENDLKQALESEEIQLGISIPLLVKENLTGAIILATRTLRQVKPEELSLLSAIGQQVGMAVENARLYEQAEQTAITTERSRLARELHDSVTQLLYSVTLYAEAAAELLKSGEIETAAGHLRDLRDTAQEALREMRLLIFELHRPELGEGGLAVALQARLDAVETRGGIHAELLVEGSEQISRLVQAELYNISQEALNNALKHAHANSVRIHLGFGDAETEMQISDDGVGFEPADYVTGGGFGIPGMKERSQKIGGTLQIDSAPGKGTTIIVRVPLNPC
ncbi:MAG: two-component regulator propeller domain-containing protein [Anaerolineales bacterium]|jgi:ligand-binding sensor domain-containing protein/signal transduction histidine kinase